MCSPPTLALCLCVNSTIAALLSSLFQPCSPSATNNYKHCSRGLYPHLMTYFTSPTMTTTMDSSRPTFIHAKQFLQSSNRHSFCAWQTPCPLKHWRQTQSFPSNLLNCHLSGRTNSCIGPVFITTPSFYLSRPYLCTFSFSPCFLSLPSSFRL